MLYSFILLVFTQNMTLIWKFVLSILWKFGSKMTFQISVHLWRYFWAKILRDDCALNQLIFPSQPHTPIEWQIHCQTNGLLSITFTTNKSGLLCLGSVSGCLAIFSAFYDFFTDRKTQSSHEQSQRRQKHSSSRQNDSPEVFFLLSY